jgi:ATP-dependent protease ClpP protease subunit
MRREVSKIENKSPIFTEVVNDKKSKLYLYGTIRKAYPWEDEGDCISAKAVKDQLIKLSGQDIDIHINSGGGDVFESIAICNLLKSHDGEISIYIDSLAGSGSSIIATAGKDIYMYPNSMQMIHKAWTIALGNSDDLKKAAEDLDKIDTAVAASYMSKFTGTEEELKQLLSYETYMTAEEALAFGFCTKIIDAEEKESEPQQNIKESLF